MPQSEFWPLEKGRMFNIESNADTDLLQKQLGDMEGEVKDIQMELAAIRRNRLDLTSRRKGLAVPPNDETMPDTLTKGAQQTTHDVKFATLSKVSKLQEELIKATSVANEERFQKERYENKLKELENKLNHICSHDLVAELKESRKISDEEVASLKLQMRNMKEESEELKITLNEKKEQLQDYRLKYLQAQQQVEELKRQLDVIEFDNKQVSDQIQIEIQKIKMQFQEKLQELAPLPDLLKGAQMQLQEAKQLQRLAEDNSHQLSNELHRVKEKLVTVVGNLNQEKVENNRLVEENKCLKLEIDEKNKDMDALTRLLDDNRCKITRLEEKLINQEALYKEKVLECSQLVKDFEESRDESARSLSRCKERADTMRRYLQTQISELERQLIQSKAHCRAFQKERDDIRQRMQIQMNNLQENFELVEIRLRTLQGQVTSLKSSYTVLLTDEEDEMMEINKRVTT